VLSVLSLVCAGEISSALRKIEIIFNALGLIALEMTRTEKCLHAVKKVLASCDGPTFSLSNFISGDFTSTISS
jgi:hypothetical protein